MKRQRKEAPGIVFGLGPDPGDLVDAPDRTHVVIGATMFFCVHARVLPAEAQAGWELVHDFTPPTCPGDLGYLADVDVHTMHTAAVLPEAFDGLVLKTAAEDWLRENRFLRGLLDWAGGIRAQTDPRCGRPNAGLRATCHAFVLPDFAARIRAREAWKAVEAAAEEVLEALRDQKPFALSWVDITSHPDAVRDVRVAKVRVRVKCRGSHSTDGDHHVRAGSVELDVGTAEVKGIEWPAGDDPVMAWLRHQGVVGLQRMVLACFSGGDTPAYFHMLECEEVGAAVDADTYKAGDSVGCGTAVGHADMWVVVPDDIRWRLSSYPIATYDQELVRAARTVVDDLQAVDSEGFVITTVDCYEDEWFQMKGGLGVEGVSVKVHIKRSPTLDVERMDVFASSAAKAEAEERGFCLKGLLADRLDEVADHFPAEAWKDDEVAGTVWVYFLR
jgi:hypothetical protein